MIQRVAADAYPYAVATAGDGSVYVSAWGASSVNAFRADSGGRLAGERTIAVGRHPSALVLSADGTRLFAASASTDRIAVVDTRARRTIRWLVDPPPGGVLEGSTPNALALSADGTRLFVAEADVNAVAVFALPAQAQSLWPECNFLGRIPTQWYPTAVDVHGDSVGGEQQGPGARQIPRTTAERVVSAIVRAIHARPVERVGDRGRERARRAARCMPCVAHANGWDHPSAATRAVSPFEHVVYHQGESHGDQALGDLCASHVLSSVSPNHHARAERFGIFNLLRQCRSG